MTGPRRARRRARGVCAADHVDPVGRFDHLALVRLDDDAAAVHRRVRHRQHLRGDQCRVVDQQHRAFGHRPDQRPVHELIAPVGPLGVLADEIRDRSVAVAGDGHHGFEGGLDRARRLHWDCRLERDGVLVSGAIPKGRPEAPTTNRLAIRTEDHPLEYASFEGEIPPGQYVAGTVRIWDRGTYEPQKWTDEEIKVVIHGSRASGRYVLIHIRNNQWLVPPDGPAAPSLVNPPPDRRDALRGACPQAARVCGRAFATRVPGG